MSSYYSDETSTDKKQRLSEYFENIKTALDKINGVSINGVWTCKNGDSLRDDLDTLKSKITQIKNCLNDYISFLDLVNSEYGQTSDDINNAVSSYLGK